MKSQAKAEGLSVSEYLRREAIHRTHTASNGKNQISEHRDAKIGRIVLKGPPGTPALTTETVKALLADFP